MKTSRPYLIRAINDWINDNQCTPNILVDANYPDVIVPRDKVKDGQIVLNIKPESIRNFKLTNEFMQFTASFNSVMKDVYIPVMAVMGIFARENGQGMVFDTEVSPEPEVDDEPVTVPAQPKPTLRVVK